MGILALFGAALLKAALPGLATVASGYAVGILHKLLKRQGIKLSKEREAQLEKIVEDAILRTEEAARRNPDMTSDEKVAMTVVDARPGLIAATGEILERFEIEGLIDKLLPDIRRRLMGSAKSTEPTLGSR